MPSPSSSRRKNRKSRSQRPYLRLDPLEVRALFSAVLQITGNGNAIANGSQSPTVDQYTDFGPMITTVDAAIGSLTRTYVLTNTGDETLNLTGNPDLVEVDGLSAADFTVTTAPASTIDPGSSTSFTVTFQPQTAGPAFAQLTVFSSDPLAPSYVFSIQGTGVAATNLGNDLFSATLAGGIGLGATTGTDLTVNYTGYLTDGTQFDSSLDQGRSPLEFTLGDTQVIAGINQGLVGIEQGETRVLFIPAALGYGTQGDGNLVPGNSPLIFNVMDLAGVAPTITVAGNGTTIANGDLAPSASDFTDFGSMSTTPGSLGVVTRTFTISNTGGGDLNLTGSPDLVTIDGPNSTDFAVTVNPSQDIAAGVPSTFTISFVPTNIGLRQATVTIDSTDPNVPAYSFAIKGNGLDTVNSQSGLELAVNTTGSGNPAVNGSDVSLNLTGTLLNGTVFDNTGTGLLTDIVLGHPDVIAGLDQGLLGILPGETRTIFIPAALAYGASSHGNIPANSDLIYNISVANVSAPAIAVNISGNGNTIVSGDTSPSFTDFTDFGAMSTTVNSTLGKMTRTFVITDAGGLALNLTGAPLVSISGANKADFVVTTNPSSAQLSPGATTSFTITFTPHGTGTRKALVTVLSSDPNVPFYTYAIQGKGAATKNSANGLQVVTTTAGTGQAALVGSDVKINYTGYLMDGTVFDSSSGTGSEFIVGSPTLIAGFNQGLVGLKPGETRTIFIPSSLGYGTVTQGVIPPNSPLVFTVTGITVLPSAVSVQGNGQTILPGDTKPTTLDFTDFRVWTMNEEVNSSLGNVTRTYTISNAGAGDVVLTGTKHVTVSGANASDFIVTSQPGDTIDAGSSSTFTVEFVPHGTGKRSATITVHSGDPLHPTYTFAVQGTGIKTQNDTTNHLEGGILKAGTLDITSGGQSSVVVDYTGWLLDGTVFDSSVFDSAAQPGHSPLTLEVDTTSHMITGNLLQNGQEAGGLIQGWPLGLQGIKAGETRTLIIPAALGYGDDGNPPSIPGGATLIFIITAQPHQLVVFANGTIITPGETTPDPSNDTNMGTLTAGSNVNQLNQMYNLTGGGNPTGLSLTSLNVGITGTGKSDFSSSIIGFDTTNGTNFVINFHPAKPGTYTAVAHVKSNDPIHPDYQFTISASEDSWIDLSPTVGTIVLPTGGTVTSGTTTKYNVPVTVTNVGTITANASTASGMNVQILLHKTTDPDNSNDIVLFNGTTNTWRTLSAHASKTLTIPVTIPIAAGTGTYQIITEVNTVNSVLTEFDATNNTATSAQIIHVIGGDFGLSGQLTASTFPAALIPTQVLTGSLSVSFDNTGTLAIPAGQKLTIQLVAIDDSNTANHIDVGTPSTLTLSALSVHATSSSFAFSKALLAGLPAGTYTLGFDVTPTTALGDVAEFTVSAKANAAAIHLAVT